MKKNTYYCKFKNSKYQIYSQKIKFYKNIRDSIKNKRGVTIKLTSKIP